MAEYIDRQAAKDTIEKEWDGVGGQYEAWAIIKDTCDAIDEVPPADVRPVVRGKWEPRDLTYGRSYYFCSVCEMTVDMPTAMGIPMFRYCPYCGADMKGGGAL